MDRLTHGITLHDIRAEAATAAERYGDFTSTHEALGVLSEEWDELREAIHANDLGRIYREAVQVAAVALRLADQCHAALMIPPRVGTVRATFLQRSGLGAYTYPVTVQPGGDTVQAGPKPGV
jgi:hypothetical protein